MRPQRPLPPQSRRATVLGLSLGTVEVGWRLCHEGCRWTMATLTSSHLWRYGDTYSRCDYLSAVGECRVVLQDELDDFPFDGEQDELGRRGEGERVREGGLFRAGLQNLFFELHQCMHICGGEWGVSFVMWTDAARTHEKLVHSILNEEDNVIASHRRQIEDNMDLVTREMSLLQ